MDAETLRIQTFVDLNALGFKLAWSLPSPDLGRVMRPVVEIAARLMALDAVYRWVAFSKSPLVTKRITNYVNKNRLREWMITEEDRIIDMPRFRAYRAHGSTIGWKLENMWPLAWLLGFHLEPTIEASQIENPVSQAIVHDFLPGSNGTLAGLVEYASPRDLDEVIALEYRFYCAHNAVRNSQVGRDTVPSNFHPVVHGGAVHERRHALTWSLSPGIPWDESNLLHT